mmetsp:Transcript_14179/g.21386  ORF Transcript_14179/g.21386 Transcript_14179/m.21386 type:complete len:139 (+) Transcript_14179:66-482(+)|eukprot:CAMPEP_0196140996 /NCGR_PEP_ID=MMETSP0910-20130528/8273_1 /TAXON_ID=49265 /ORGANISM="Thalassiosira rotula, Strain GSO102" /LENGTH=138 /DNA_ID=CAMNT_0041401991 /DNA_START=42 /DNA_END=458 /DNA_ORIENTATION=+
MTKLLHTAAITLLCSGYSAMGQELPHQRRILHRPDQPSIREMVTQKFERQEELLTSIIQQQQAKVDDHLSGRKLLDDEEFAHHQRHIKGLKRKLYATKQKDPELVKLEIEHEIELQERMLEGEFIWTPGSDELVLKNP